MVKTPLTHSSRLILIDGLPGSGKSTTAQYLAMQLQRNGFEARWFYETESDHPIYTELADGQDTLEFVETTLAKWRSFAHRAGESDVVTILESSIFQCTVEELLLANVERDEIREFAHSVQAIVGHLKPILIYLYQDDVELALREICRKRGADWQDWFVDEITTKPFARSENLTGFGGLVAFYRICRGLTDELFAEFECLKIGVETSGGDWRDRRRKILNFLSVPFKGDDPKPESYLRSFVGTYETVEGAPRYGTTKHEVKLEDGSLFVYNLWLRKSRLIPKDQNVFSIEASCCDLIFEPDGSGSPERVTVGGSTMGGFENRVLVRAD